MTLRVLIADDHPMVLDGLRALITHAPSLDLVGEASNGREAVDLAADLQPDVVVLDLQMPGVDGVTAAAELLAVSPASGVLALTMFHDDDWLFAAMRAGARGYVLKGASREEILRAIEAVGAGHAIFSPAMADRMIASAVSVERPSEVRAGPFAELTTRELEVLDLVAAGLANRVIAQRLFLSPKTVRNHVSNVFTKLGVVDRSQAIVLAREHGMGGAPAGAVPAGSPQPGSAR